MSERFILSAALTATLAAAAQLSIVGCAQDDAGSGLASADSASGENGAAGTVKLFQYWSASRTDNYVGTALPQGVDYVLVRQEACLPSKSSSKTKALLNYFNAARGDNVASATAEGQAIAVKSEYQLIVPIGLVFVERQPGTVALRAYWNAARHDNILVAEGSGGDQGLTDIGYQFLRVEGFAYPPSHCGKSTGEVATHSEAAPAASKKKPKPPKDQPQVATPTNGALKEGESCNLQLGTDNHYYTTCYGGFICFNGENKANSPTGRLLKSNRCRG